MESVHYMNMGGEEDNDVITRFLFGEGRLPVWSENIWQCPAGRGMTGDRERLLPLERNAGRWCR